ncbi:uncharacterized protein si:ch1073-126c3.2 isoform X2 [Syngnathus acus]|uniref:uncharacterized protein si:ch1073-126c3.2 isoform X1 n=1 Tax=Syngnathus acus TaxID=161584 RepID=UPI001885B1A3|nr:uncharacterized protein si:ch1073-126c3.2 isoform X1 [Syngnathus acus]XP_037128100.1 uncharacterized protein si:ch1073-126c3.2 isoform X1 [Syngnathus acus]XP_037128101.1 uncharacterized protein si:ch1073-126c3.2 isoform X2 [Syngnathus acus]
MALKGILACLCLVAAVFPCSHQDDVQTNNCSSHLLEELSDDLKMAAECNTMSRWTPQQRATLLLYMRNLTEMLHTQHLRECQGGEPVNCPQPEVPKNGGLVCTTVANRRFCKALCNHGYDFAFLRRSRVFDECSAATGYKWRSQYIGGNTLAVCNEATLQVAGAKTAYFPKDEDCLTTKGQEKESDIVLQFEEELKNHDGVDGAVESACLLCG